ncbi:hypothetical protein [Nitrospirillum viridazoti]|uniref:hypothetical protein n=1 Tax=Nitrospirillum viridazoti TaxID=3144925 RepID=UPI0011A2C018|nr:hypothetical protein [Nitrospirillum amazonense]
MEITGLIVINNTTKNSTITVDETVADHTNASVSGDKPWSLAKKITIPPVSGVGSIQFEVDSGVWTDATKDRISIPVTVSQDGKQDVNGIILIKTICEDNLPKFVTIDLNVGSFQSSQSLETGSDKYIGGDIGEVYFSISDEGLDSAAGASEIPSITGEIEQTADLLK